MLGLRDCDWKRASRFQSAHRVVRVNGADKKLSSSRDVVNFVAGIENPCTPVRHGESLSARSVLLGAGAGA